MSSVQNLNGCLLQFISEEEKSKNNDSSIQKMEQSITDLWRTIQSVPEGKSFLKETMIPHELEQAQNGYFLPLLNKYTLLSTWLKHNQLSIIAKHCKIQPSSSLSSVEGVAEIITLLKEKLKEQEAVSLSKLNLHEVPEEFFECCPNVKHLDLSHNNLSNLKGITRLDHLKRLNISFNQFVKWPEELAIHFKLDSLNISNNQLNTRPPQIFSDSVTSINFNRNKFKSTITKVIVNQPLDCLSIHASDPDYDKN
jgi:Leucine-rich repeat (LRR) protein